jgi:hypothetical protein
MNVITHPLSITIGNKTIFSVPFARNIGAIFDQNLSMDRHVNSICKSAYYQIHKIGLIRKFLTVGATKSIVYALVTSKLDGLNSLLVGCLQAPLGNFKEYTIALLG